MEQRNILEADGIVLNFGLQKVLSDVYIKCEQGEVVGVLGRNGAGKSLLFKTIFGIQPAESKSIRINSHHTDAHVAGKEITFLPQHPFIPNNITIGTALSLYKIQKSVVLEDYAELEESLTLRPDQVSGGLLRLIEILLIVHSNSKFCLLDEPFSGLAPVIIDRVKRTLRKISEKKGILITDHLYRHITNVSDRIYIMANGRTREISQWEDLVKYGYLHEA